MSKDEYETWEASWQGEFAVLDEFIGTKSEAIPWAREKSPRVWRCTEAHDDVALPDPRADS